MQRQSTPPIASVTSFSVGVGLRLQQRGGRHQHARGTNAALRRSVAKKRTSADVRTSGARPERPSTVVTSWPSACAAETRQEQTGCPSNKTVQAPQSPASQPTFVPVRPKRSRRTRDSRSAGGTATDTLRPLTTKLRSACALGLGGLITLISDRSLRRRPALAKSGSALHRHDNQRWRARPKSVRSGSRCWGVTWAPIPVRAGTPINARSRALSLCAVAEHEPTATRASLTSLLSSI